VAIDDLAADDHQSILVLFSCKLVLPLDQRTMASVQLSLSVLVPNYEEYFLEEAHSDVSIVIVEEAFAVDMAGQRLLPGHSMVLMAFSGYCKAKVNARRGDA
jgi:hypothetical protein